MKSYLLKIITTLTICITLAFAINFVDAASIGISVGYSTITVGGTTKMTITGNDVIGKVSITSSAPNVVSVSSSSLWVEGSASLTLTTKSVGSAVITVSAVDMSDSSGNAYSGSKSITITSKPVYIDTRSTNNNLSSIQIAGYTLKEEFSSANTSYSLEVPYNVETLEVAATVADNAAKYSVSGNTGLKAGENNITITVTAENGAQKAYYIKVIKEKDPADTNIFLKKLELTGATLRNEFNKEQFYYLCEDLSVEVDKIGVIAEAEVEDAKVEITGNKDLKAGLNAIEVLVTSRDTTNAKKYRICVYKSAEMLSLKEVEEESKSIKEYIKDYWQQLTLLAIVIIELVIIIILLTKKKGNDNNKYYERKKTEDIDNENKEQQSYFNDIKIEDQSQELTEDNLKYSDPDENNKVRRHRRNY